MLRCTVTRKLKKVASKLREENKFPALEREVFRAIVGPKKGEVGEPVNQLYISYDEVTYISVNP